ncbi:MAG: hypothetical protein ACM3Q4_10440 [Acidobacteriota bacterium]
MMKYFHVLVLLVLISTVGGAQALDPRYDLYRKEAKGNVTNRKEGIMDGNLVRTLYYNHGEVAKYQFQPSGEWPKGSGHSYLDGVTVIVGTTLHTANGTVHSIATQYREEMDYDKVTHEYWGFEPLPGYDNPSVPKPAMSIDTASFPKVWPASLGLTDAWNGYWYGYFGRGVKNADFETFFVMDDSKDREYQQPPYLYYPIASDSTRAGAGLRVEVRGFQWSHVLAEDIIFWHYDIVNISDRNIDSTCFGFFSDPGVGGTNSGEDDAYYNTALDICYAWDHDFKGNPNNYQTGYYGYAYLESPGNATNGIDDDGDGMIDERRDDGIDNDHDWVRYTDLNGNGSWDKGEPLNNDVGRDGLGPFDVGYAGPDEGEGDGVPTHGEPNFDETDKDESDQIGLSSVSLTILADKGPSGVWPKNDEVLWKKMTGGFVDTSLTNTNISIVFSSGPFPLKKGTRERYSMALVFGNDLTDILFNKVTVQNIYNANYNFSKPPYTPTLTAVPGNGRVYLYWNSIAEESRDQFLGFQNGDATQGYKKDFEGYLLYRSEEAEFNDIKVITDSRGEAKYWKPMAQWDVVDNIKGPDPVGINGASFWRGSETGLQHSYVDSTVKNGTRYYYALVSYDQGDPKFGTTGLQPTECTKIITEDYAGQLKFVDINCAVVTPNAAAAGYLPPQVIGNPSQVTSGIGTGAVRLDVVNPGLIREGAQYKILFKGTGQAPKYFTDSYSIIRSWGAATDTLMNTVSAREFGLNNFSQPFDGLVFSFRNDTVVAVIDTATGWAAGSKSNLILRASADVSNQALNAAWPGDYEIRFSSSPADTTLFDAPNESDPAQNYPMFPVNFTITNTTSGKRVKCIVQDIDNSKSLTIGDTIRIVDGFKDESDFKLVWAVSYGRSFGVPVLPTTGDKFVVRTTKPFANGDFFSFKTKEARTDVGVAKDSLSRISVVPNPYIASASWERRTLYSSGRGDRKIDFIHLPRQCTVRIYTVAGALVKTLHKDSGPTDGALSWDLISDDGMEVAYGLYIYHVDAPGIGEHIGKFAVVK